MNRHRVWGKMPTFVHDLAAVRQQVQKCIDDEGITIYALSKRLNGIVAQKSVYDFFDERTTDIRYNTVMSILHVCGFDFRIGRPVDRPKLKDQWKWDAKATELESNKNAPE